MGISTSGTMLIGSEMEKIIPPDDIEDDFDEIRDWMEENDLERFAQHYDADDNYCYMGFPIEDIAVEDMNEEWVTKIKLLVAKFQALTKNKAYLIGTQDIT